MMSNTKNFMITGTDRAGKKVTAFVYGDALLVLPGNGTAQSEVDQLMGKVVATLDDLYGMPL